jgi:hypothetical protein
MAANRSRERVCSCREKCVTDGGLPFGRRGCVWLHSDAEGAWVAEVDRAGAGVLIAVFAASAASLVRFAVVGLVPRPVVMQM